MLILCCLTHITLLDCSTHILSWIARHLLHSVLLGTWIFLDCSAPKYFWIARHLNIFGSVGTYYVLSCSTWTVTQHLYIAWHPLLTRHLLRFWLGTYYDSAYIVYSTYIVELVKSVDTQMSKPFQDQQSPPLTWVSKTLNYALLNLTLWVHFHSARHRLNFLKTVQNFVSNNIPYDCP